MTASITSYNFTSVKSIKFILAILILPVFVFAQNGIITGKVINIETQEALIGASIINPTTSQGVITDLSGEFSIVVSDDTRTLEVSYLGYENQIINLEGNQYYEVVMREDNYALNEVVITALNLERSSKDLGYAIQELNSKEISEVKSVNFIDNLGGRVAGLTVNQGSSGVGSTTKVTIRGESSFSNNNPLFVVDGLPIQNNTDLNFTNEAAAGFQEVDFGSGAMDINQDDIESVSVLKGPSAAALYGTRAANGVILINTKKGTKNQGLKVDINTSLFVDTPFALPKFQNEFGQGNSGEFNFLDGLGGGINDNISYSWGPETNAGNLVSQFDSPVFLDNGQEVRGGDVAVHGGADIPATELIAHPDNLKDFYETGVTTISNVALSNGFNKGSYRLSFTDLRSDSYIPGVDFNRKAVSARFNIEPLKGLNISTNANYSFTNSGNRPSSGYGSENISYSLVAWGPRSLDTSILQDYWQPGLEGQQQYSFNYTFFDNPYFILNENTNAFGRNRLYGNIIADYEIAKGLSIQGSIGNDNTSELRQFTRRFSTNRFSTGAYAEQDISFNETNMNFLLRYQRQINDFNATISFGGNRMDQRASSQQQEAIGQLNFEDISLANSATPITELAVQSRKRINSLYSLLELSYKDFLYVDITGRNDWSSALATPTSTANTSLIYPSVSASYIASQHLPLPDHISFLKLRASWAQVGNDTDPFQTEGTFVQGIPYAGETTFTNQGVIANTNLKPEQTTAIEVGGDIRFFDDRISLDVSYYNAVTRNQIISFAIPVSSGFNQEIVNGGAVRSKGVEVLAGLRLIRNKNFNWSSYVNFSRNNSVVESLPDGAGRITLGYSRVYDNQNQTVWFQVEEGGRIGDLYGTGYSRNENGDFIINEEGAFIGDNNLKRLGNYNPDFIVGLSNEFSYKNWNASFLLDWRQGGSLVSRTLSLAAVGGQLIETLDRPAEGIIAEGVVNVGTESEPVWQENTTAVSPESYYRQFYDRNHEENNVYDASYVKLRSLSIGYRLDSGSKLGFLKDDRTLTINLIGRNLFAISNIPHFDPEQLAVQGNQFVSGVEDISYPTARSIGIKLGLSL